MAPITLVLSKHWCFYESSRVVGELCRRVRLPAPGAVMGNVRAGVSLPSGAQQTLPQPLNGGLELPPHAFITC